MERAFFKYRNKTSDLMGLRLLNDVAFVIPEYDIEFREIPGRDGDFAIDKKRYKPIIREFPCTVSLRKDVTVEQTARRIAAWLYQKPGYSPLWFSGQPGYYQQAICYETLPINEVLRHFGKVVIKFKCQPYRYRMDGERWYRVPKDTRLHNPEMLEAKPMIRIQGSGDITLLMNNQRLDIRGLAEGIVIDCDREMAHWKGERLNHLIASYPFPSLPAGDTVFTWVGQVQSLEIQPRWRTIL